MTQPRSNPSGRWLIGILACALFILHQDFWWWDSRTLVLGFMPIGLFYHAVFSVAAGLLWALANKIAWPSHIEDWAGEVGPDSADKGGHQ